MIRYLFIILFLVGCSQLPKDEICELVDVVKGYTQVGVGLKVGGGITNTFTVHPDKKRYFCYDGIYYTVTH